MACTVVHGNWHLLGVASYGVSPHPALKQHVWLNITFLLCVSFIPFPAALLGHYFGQRIAVIIYAATLGFTSLVGQALWLYAARGHRLVDANISPEVVAEISRKNLTGSLLYTLAIAVSFLSLPLSIGILLLVPVLFILPSRVRKRKGFR